MGANGKTALLCAAIASSLAFAAIAADGTVPGDAVAQSSDEKLRAEKIDVPLPTMEEARARARLLHEAVHSTLQIVHRRYYREDEGLPIPAFTLKHVFSELEERSGVKVQWLVVDGEAMNVGHRPRNEFEKAAAKALASGAKEFGHSEAGLYRHAGPIRLHNDCLKCHVPSRTSTEDRTAGLVIMMPVKSD